MYQTTSHNDSYSAVKLNINIEMSTTHFLLVQESQGSGGTLLSVWIFHMEEVGEADWCLHCPEQSAGLLSSESESDGARAVWTARVSRHNWAITTATTVTTRGYGARDACTAGQHRLCLVSTVYLLLSLSLMQIE